MIFSVISKIDGVEVTRYCAGEITESFDGKHFPQSEYGHVEYVVDPVETPADPANWRIYVGAFFDRFGAYKIPILSSDDPIVQALVKDAGIRKYIGLYERRGELLQMIGLLQSKGFAVDAAAILDTPPTDEERWND